MSISHETAEQNIIIIIKDEESDFFEEFTRKNKIYWSYDSKVNKILPLSKSLVGYINTPVRTIPLLPKYHEIGFEHIVRMYMYVYGYKPTDNAAILDVSIKDISEDLVDIFIIGLKANIQEGILRLYNKNTKQISTIKGQVNFKKSLINSWLLKRKPIVSKVSALSMNNIYNNIILSALYKIRHIERYATISNELIMYFEGAEANITKGSEALEEINFNANTARYRKTLVYAAMIIDNLAYNDSGTCIGTDSFLINFDRLFEEFIVKILKEIPEKKDFSTWIKKHSLGDVFGRYGKIDSRQYQPDILYRFLEEDERVDNKMSAYAVLDVKNKAYSLFKNSDIYQILTYAKLLHSSSAILIYPSFQRKRSEKFVLEENIFIPSFVSACFVNIADMNGNDFLTSIEYFVDSIVKVLDIK